MENFGGGTIVRMPIRIAGRDHDAQAAAETM
jgi:hypothetical protein